MTLSFPSCLLEEVDWVEVERGGCRRGLSQASMSLTLMALIFHVDFPSICFRVPRYTFLPTISCGRHIFNLIMTAVQFLFSVHNGVLLAVTLGAFTHSDILRTMSAAADYS